MFIGCNYFSYVVLKRVVGCFFLVICCRKCKDLFIKIDKLFYVFVVILIEIIIEFNFKIRLIIVLEVV